MQSSQFFEHRPPFRSSHRGSNSNPVRRRNIEQRTPSRDVPRNVMEALVAEEIEAQMQLLSVRDQQTLQRSQIMGYALNRLPGLYVTSEKGWERQWSQGKNKYQCPIKIAVRQGVAAVLRDPLRDVTVLSSHPPDVAEAALTQLRRLLMRQELSWHNIVATVQMLLVMGDMEFPDAQRSRRSQASSPQVPSSQASSSQAFSQASPSPSSPSSQAVKGVPAAAKLRPESAQALEIEREVEAPPSDFFDWDSHPLHQRGY